MCSSDLNLQLNLAPEMLQLRYANYPKDYFMGMLPSSQYGSVAVLPSSYLSSQPSSRVVSYKPGSVDALFNPQSKTSVEVDKLNSASAREIHLNSDLSALSIRATE